MSFKPLSTLGRGFRLFWRALDATRRTLFNLLFLLFLIIVLWATFGGGIKSLAPKTALVLNLRGTLVEQTSGNVRDALMANVRGDAKKTVQLRDVLTVLDNAGRGGKDRLERGRGAEHRILS